MGSCASTQTVGTSRSPRLAEGRRSVLDEREAHERVAVADHGDEKNTPNVDKARPSAPENILLLSSSCHVEENRSTAAASSSKQQSTEKGASAETRVIRDNHNKVTDSNKSRGSFSPEPIHKNTNGWGDIAAAGTGKADTTEGHATMASREVGDPDEDDIASAWSEMEAGYFSNGDVIGGHFAVVTRLGDGDLGTTYLARPAEEDKGTRLFALKLIHFDERPHLLEAIESSQKKIAALHEKNVVGVYDVLGTSDSSSLVVVTPYAALGSVHAQRVKVASSLTLLHKVVVDVAHGLRQLHKNGLCHGSLKLENILEIEEGLYAVADAGYDALYADCTLDALAELEHPSLLAPEVITTSDRAALDKSKLDIWAFGIVLYQLAFGLNPFLIPSQSIEQLRRVVTEARILVPTHANASTSVPFVEVIQRCLAKDPAVRPSIEALLMMDYFSTAVDTHAVTKIDRLMSQAGVQSANPSSNVADETSIKEKGGGTADVAVVKKVSKKNFAGVPERFRVDSRLGKGAHGSTFRVTVTNVPGEILVFKALRECFSEKLEKFKESHQRREYLRHIAVGRKISGPCIQGHVEFVELNGLSSVTHIYWPKGSVASTYPTLQSLDVVILMLHDVLRGLEALHHNESYHGNLKPTNVFYGNNGRFVIAEFGPIYNFPQEVPFDFLPENLRPSPNSTAMSDLVRCAQLSDLFSVGVLAACVDASLRELFIRNFYQRSVPVTGAEESAAAEKRIVDTQHILHVLRQHKFPENYVSFVESALSGVSSSASNLLTNPLFGALSLGANESGEGKKSGEQEVGDASPPPLVTIHQRDYKFAVKSTFECGEVQMFGFGLDQYIPEDEVADVEFEFYSTRGIKCCICKALMEYVVYFSDEYATARCGKCVNVPPITELRTMLIYRVQRFVDHVDGKSVAHLFETKHFPDFTLEQVEMEADFPVGSLVPMVPPPSPNIGSEEPDIASKPVVMMESSVSVSAVNKSMDRNNSIGMHSRSVSTRREAGKGKDGWTTEAVIEAAVLSKSKELSLYDLKLLEVPSTIFSQSFAETLVFIDLSSNDLTTLPDDIGCFTNLRTLRVSHNKLKEIPVTIGDLSSLVLFDVAHNLLEDLPQEIMFCDDLQQLIADYNEFTMIPECIFDMPSIQTALLAENKKIRSWPSLDVIKEGMRQRSVPLKLTIDNRPSLYREFQSFTKKVSGLLVSWNRIYPDYVAPNLYCGSLRSAQTLSVYEQLNIGYVLTMGRGLEPIIPEGMHHKTIVVDDIPNAKIDVSFDEAIEFIDESIRNDKGCLVHCFAGLSRSATAVIAYLMEKQGMRLDDAYMLTKKGRPNIYPNDGFFAQLLELDKKLFSGQRALELGQLQRGVIPT